MKRPGVLLLIVVASCAYGPGLNPSNSSESNVDPNAPAALSAISPTAGVHGGVLAITGTNLSQGATVTVGGVECTSPTALSSTELTCDLGAAKPGKADVVVSNPGTEPATLAEAFTYRMFLYLLEDTRIKVFEIASGGIVTEVPSAHVTLSTGQSRLVTDPKGKYLYTLEQSGNYNGFTISGTDGTLSAVPGSPFALSAGTTWLKASPGGQALYSSAAGSISIASINRTTGALTLLGTAGGDGYQDAAATPDGKFLYAVKDGGNGIGGFQIDPVNGGLSGVGDVSGAFTRIETDNTSQLVIAGNSTTSGKTYRINANGSLTEASTTTPLLDEMVASPKFAFLYSVETSNTKLLAIDAAQGSLTDAESSGFTAGSIMTIDSSGTFLTVDTDVYALDPTTGRAAASGTASGTPVAVGIN